MLSSDLATALVYIGLFLIVVGVRYLLHQEGPRAFGLHLDARGWRLLAEGALAGALAFGAYPLIVVLIGRGELRLAPEAAGHTVGLLGAWLFGFGAAALFEESLFRGYLLPKFLRRLPLPVAIALPALLYGLIHLLSFDPASAPWLAVANAALFGVVMSLATIGARSLMWAVGFHLAWHLTQATLFGGQDLDGDRPISMTVEAGLLAGTAAVPEGGLVVTAITLAMAAVTVARFGRPSAAAYRAAPPAEAARPAPGGASGGDR